MRPERYPTLVALEPFGLEYLRESLVLRIDQTLRRMCQCIGHCVLSERHSSAIAKSRRASAWSGMGWWYIEIQHGFYPKVSEQPRCPLAVEYSSQGLLTCV